MNNIITYNSKFKIQNYNSKFKTDLKKRCFDFSLSVIFLTDTLSNKKSSHIISNQLIRSATSIGANIVEAKASSSRLEFKKFHEIALKSANETIYWLELLRDSRMADSAKIETLLNEVGEICKMLAAGVIKLKQRSL